MSPGGQSKLFVVGLPRSGTTLLCSLLNKHPSIALMYECDALAVPEPFASLRLHRDWLVRLEFWSRALTRNHCHLHPDAGALRNIANPAELYEFYAEGKGASISGEKSLEYCQCLPRLVRLFPEVRIIVIRREFWQVYRSIVNEQRDGRFPDVGILNRLIYTREKLIRGTRALREQNARVHLVDYSALVENPVGICRELCAFLEIEFDPGMVTLGELGDVKEKDFTTEAVNTHLERTDIQTRDLGDSLVCVADMKQILRFQRRWDRLEGRLITPGANGGEAMEPTFGERFSCFGAGAALSQVRIIKRILYEFLPLEWLDLYRSLKRSGGEVSNRGLSQVLALIGKEHLFFQRVSPIAHIAVSLLALAIVAIADLKSGPAVTMAPFYLVPVFLMTRKCGAPLGRITALISASVWTAIQISQSGLKLPEFPVFVWDTTMRFIMFLVFIAMLIRLLPQTRGGDLGPSEHAVK